MGKLSFVQVFRWAFIVLEALKSLMPLSVLKGRLLFSPQALSTHFSGVGTAEQAMRLLQVASLEVFGAALPHVVISVCEPSAGCQGVLKQVVSPDACILHNILSRCPGAARLFAEAKAAGELKNSVEEVWRHLRQSGCTENAGKCHHHPGGNCATPRSTGDISGTPCQLWSSAGKRLATTSHLIILMLTWALWVRWALPLFAVHENVLGFPVSFLEWLLGDLYCMTALQASPGQVGLHFARRTRVYVVLWLDRRVEAKADIADTYAKVIARFSHEFPCKFPLSSAFVATEDEVQSELHRVQNKQEKALFLAFDTMNKRNPKQ
jgi:hypothetical protein